MSNEFDAAVASAMQPDPAQAARIGFSIASDTNPDTYAEAQRVARRTGVPVDTVFAMPKEMKRQDAMGSIDFGALAATSPATAALLADVERAKVAHDDVENMGAIERGLAVLKTAGRSTARLVGDAPAAAYSVISTGAGFFAPLLDPLAGTILPENPLRRVQVGFNDLRKDMQGHAQAIQGEIPKDAGVIERNFYGAMQSIGQQAPGIVTSLVTRNPAYALGSMGVMTAGQSMAEATDAGNGPARAMYRGLADGTAEVFFERFGVNKLLGDVAAGSGFGKMLLGQIVREVPGEMATTMVQNTNEWLISNPDKSVADFVAAQPESQRDTILTTIMQTVMTAGIGKGASVLMRRGQQAQQAEQTTQVLAHLDELAKASKLRGRDADTFEQFITANLEDGPVQDVFISANALMQSGMAEQIAAVSPSVAEQMQIAMETGGDVRIPVAEYTARIAGTELSAPLMDHIKTDPNGMSRIEAQDFMQTQAAQLQQEVERALTDKQHDDTFKASQDVVKTAVLENLNAANRFTPQKNEFDATLIAARTAVRAAQLGITPEALFQKQMLRVQAQGVDGALHYGQGAVPLDQIRQQWADAGIDFAVIESGDLVTLSKIVVPETSRGQGIATKAMQQLVEWADANGKHLALSPASDFGGNKKRLTEFYKRFGFIENKGKNRAFQTSESMYRQAPDKVLYQFAGQASAAADQHALTTAQQRLNSGDDAETVRKETGWFKGVDGKWRYEINDADAKLRPDAVQTSETEDGQEYRHAKLGELLDHPALFAAYPALRDVDVGFAPRLDSSGVYHGGLDIGGMRSPPTISIKHSGEAIPSYAEQLARLDRAEARSIASSMADLDASGATAVEREEELAAVRGDYQDVRDKLHAIIESGAKAPAMFDAADLGIILHEIQHAIQDVEGFATGGSPEDPAVQAIGRKMVRQDMAEGNILGGVNPADLLPMAYDNAYRRLAGEVEARNTQARAGLTDQDRLAASPESTADTAGNNVIVLFNGKEMASVPPPANAAPSTPRGAFDPTSNTIALLKNADLSTFLHEGGHYFFENDIALASELVASQREGASLTDGEQQIIGDVSALLAWHGIHGDIDAQLAQWHTMGFEEKRSYHERTAESFEAYLFEGKAPSIELQRVFQTFRAWLLNVYKSLKSFLEANPEAGKLNDQVRGVFDRMLATTEQIQLAEQGRSMMPLFKSAMHAGMTPEEFHRYQSLGVEATQAAIQDLQARGLRDMQWLHNARGREIKNLQKQANELRAEQQMEARREIMSQPVYQAWQFLTGKLRADDKVAAPGKPKSDPNIVDETQDSLFTAIAKLGGLSKSEVIAQWGTDPTSKPASGVFGKPVWRVEGGKSIDAMIEALGQHGYLPLDKHGKADGHYLEDRFAAEARGDKVYADGYDYAPEQKPGNGVTLDNTARGKLDAASLVDMTLPDAVLQRVRDLKMGAKEGGIHPDIVAEMFGFTSGDELVRKLADAEKPSDAIEGLTDAKMLQRYGDLASPEAIERAADKAIHNDARMRFVATEANALAQATGQRKILASAARDFAQVLIARLKVRDVKPSQYANAEARAAKAAEKASKAGDIATAAAEKRNQLIQGFATKTAHEARDEIDAGLRFLKKFDSDGVRKNLDAGYLEQIDALLERFDLRKQSNSHIVRTASLRTWVQSQLNAGALPDIAETLLTQAERNAYLAEVESRDEDGELVYADDEDRIKLLAEAIDRSAKRPYKDMTVEEFRGVLDTVKQIEHLARLKHKLLTARDHAEYEAVRDDIANGIAANAKQDGKNTRTATDWLGQKLQAIKQFGAAHIKVAVWAQIMDGGKDNGPVWNYLIRPANERASMETTMRAEATSKLDAIMRPLLAKASMQDKSGKGRFFPTINDSLNWQERFALALNVGNESNMQRLLAGKGWAVQQIMPLLNSLTAEEWQGVQAVWDHFESYRPRIAEKELRVSGKEPEWIAARQITVQTADGQTVTLRGGYFPVVYDSRVNLKASQHSSAEEAKNMLKASYSAATTRRSFIKSRVEEVHGRPLLLSLQGLYSGVNDVIHDLTWHEWVIDANKLLRSKTIDAAMREHYGPEVKREFEKWRDDIVAGSRRLDHGIERAAGWLRQSVSAAGLTFNVVSAAMQPLGLSNSIVRIGATWVGKGLARYVANPVEATREAQAKSAWMTNRTRTRFRELNELRNQVQGQTAVKELMGRYGYWMMMRAQMMVDVPTWWGAYEKAIANGHDEGTAIALSDQAVKDSQGGGEDVDQSGIERGGPLIKLFTAFYGFMGTTLNLGVLSGKTEANKAKTAANMLLLYTVPAVLGSLLRDALTPGDGDDEDLVKKLIAEQLSFLMGLVAFGREFAQAGKTLMGESKGMSYSGPAGMRMIPDTYKMAQQAAQGEFDDVFRKAFVNLLGDIGGLPSAQINRTITGVKALADGETTNPAAVAFGFQQP